MKILMIKSLSSVAVILIIASLVGITAGSAAETTKTLVYQGDANPVEWIVPAPDGSKVAIVVREGSRMSLYLGKDKVGTYDGVSVPMFSANSKVFSFLAINDQKTFYVKDGQTLPPLSRSQPLLVPKLPGTYQGIALSSDGNQIAYNDYIPSKDAPALNGRFFTKPIAMFENGKAQSPHTEVGNPVFNPKSNELVYRVRDSATNDPNAQTAYIYRAGAPTTKYSNVGDPVFSPDGSRLAYWAQVSWESSVVVVDGAEQGKYPLFFGVIVFSPNSKHLAYIAGLPDVNQTAIVDGRPRGTSYKSISGIYFSYDSSHYGYVGSTGSENVVIVDDKEIARHKDAFIRGPFLGFQNTIAYIVQTGARSYIHINGRREGPYAWISYPVFSNDGKHVAYFAIDGISNKYKIIVDSIPSEEYVFVTPPRFLDNNKVEYFAVEDGLSKSVFRITLSP